MRKIAGLSIIISILTIKLLAQDAIPKRLIAQRAVSPIKIDGELHEEAWKNAPLASDFIEFRPTPGQKEKTSNKTEVYILYDNTSIYVGGFCHEMNTDSISKELIGRDQIGVNDYVGVIFDTYHDKINAVGFYTTPYGEQYDAKYLSGNNGEDDTWNAVWDSEAKVLKNGWTFEMRIPHSALRFSGKDNQTWGLNITRRRNKTGQQYMWNELDIKKNGFVNQFGEWTGIEKIKSPIRLSFSPYFSSYINHYPHNKPGIKNTTTAFNGGMDLKYGINEGFTLDMTLIPDFGQVQSDNQILNLTPFEVKYNENRSFFTEGTELFNKGDLFYSRRIGATPLHHNAVSQHLNQHERIISNPSESKLVNATKISGRTNKKLGIGLFNAVTKPMYAIIEDDTNNKRRFQTSPLTNYNIIVFDQSLKNNSSVSFINTNVYRSGNDYDANVSAGLFNFNNKKNTYNLDGKIAISNLFNYKGKTVTGFNHEIALRKTGIFSFELNQELTDDKYNPNDMGILFNNNYLDHSLWLQYRWIKPTKWYNRINLNYNIYYSRRLIPADYQSLNTNVNANIQLKNLWFMGMFSDYRLQRNDFYEPRTAGRVFRRPASRSQSVWLETNYAKKYSMSAQTSLRQFINFGGSELSIYFNNRYRINDKISISHNIQVESHKNDVGFTIVLTNRDIIFARRNRTTIENILNLKYSFNNRMFITNRIRHYWSKVSNKEFFNLTADGKLSDKSLYDKNHDVNFNVFNIDMVYSWRFAPGSELNLVWKNFISKYEDIIETNYFKNFDNTIHSSQNNSLSLKLLYYLDYINLKKKKP